MACRAAETVESPSTLGDSWIADLQVSRVSSSCRGCALAVVTHDPALTPVQVSQKLAVHPEIAQATIEAYQCG